ncbi:MAG TPA: hypothetical protein VFS21_17535 [Roseiflexaceae bacterium]|nr:hypothetical protein [Roseiflexaceae bacterium]
MGRSRRPGRSPQREPDYDLDEIAPNRFVVNDSRLPGLLKGEGNFDGRFFELTTWRRDGLLARLRQRSFAVRTLADQIDDLPAPPHPPALREPCWRPLASPIERFSLFDPATLRWAPVPTQEREGAQVVVVQPGLPLRRRKGRGAPAFYQGQAERGGTLGLAPLTETEALLLGYALASERSPSRLAAPPDGDAWRLPEVELPPPYRSLLRRFATEHNGDLRVDRAGLALAQELFARLGVRLET